MCPAGAEDVVGEHGDCFVDEAQVPVAARLVGELLARQAGEYRGPEVKVGFVVESGAPEGHLDALELDALDFYWTVAPRQSDAGLMATKVPF